MVSKELAVFVASSSFNGAPCAKWQGTVDWLLPGCKMWSTNHRPLSRQLPGLSVSGTAEFRRGGPSAAWNKLRRFSFSFLREMGVWIMIWEKNLLEYFKDDGEQWLLTVALSVFGQRLVLGQILVACMRKEALSEKFWFLHRCPNRLVHPNAVRIRLHHQNMIFLVQVDHSHTSCRSELKLDKLFR